MDISTRSYYIPCNTVGRHVMNTIVDHVSCSVGDFKVNRATNTVRFTVTCNVNDFARVEKILRRYDMLGEVSED